MVQPASLAILIAILALKVRIFNVMPVKAQVISMAFRAFPVAQIAENVLAPPHIVINALQENIYSQIVLVVLVILLYKLQQYPLEFRDALLRVKAQNFCIGTLAAYQLANLL